MGIYRKGVTDSAQRNLETFCLWSVELDVRDKEQFARLGKEEEHCRSSRNLQFYNYSYNDSLLGN